MSIFKNTIESIVSDITSKVEKLHALAELKEKEAVVHDTIVVERRRLAAEAREIVARAKAVAEKFAALIEGGL